MIIYNSIKSLHIQNKNHINLIILSQVELIEKKDENPYETFREWYENDFQSFIDYNIQDVEIVDKLEDKMGLIDLSFDYRTYEGKVNYTDVFDPS